MIIDRVNIDRQKNKQITRQKETYFKDEEISNGGGVGGGGGGARANTGGDGSGTGRC